MTPLRRTWDPVIPTEIFNVVVGIVFLPQKKVLRFQVLRFQKAPAGGAESGFWVRS